MKINVSYSETINTGNYESKKIHIGTEKDYPDGKFSEKGIDDLITKEFNFLVKKTEKLKKGL